MFSVFANRSALFRGIGAHKINEEIKAFSEAIRLVNELPEGHKIQSLLGHSYRTPYHFD